VPFIPPGLAHRLEPVLSHLRADPVFFAESVTGFRLNRAQRQMLLLSGRVRVRLAGRRFGKTMLSALDLLHYALTHPGARCLVVGPSLDQARIYFDYYREWAGSCPLMEYLLSEDRYFPFSEMRFKNGSVITSRSTSRGGRYIRGRAYHRCVVTEAGFVPDQVYYAALRPTLLQNPRSVIDFEGTPWSKSSFLYDLFRKGLADGEYYSCARATVHDAPHIPAGEIERIRSEVPEYYFRMEFLAEFPEEDDAVFPQEVILAATEDYRPAGLPEPGHFYIVGVDLAKKQDYTVITIVDLSVRPHRIAEFQRFRGRRYAEVADLVQATGDRFRARVVVDATGVGEAVAERIRNCQAIVLTKPLKEDIVANLLLALESGSLLLPSSNMALLAELKHFRRIGDRIGGEAGFHDDCVISLALALWGARGKMGWSAWRSGAGNNGPGKRV